MLKMQARRGGSRSKAGGLIALCTCPVFVVACVSAAVDAVQDGLFRRSLSDAPPQGPATVSCTIPQGGAELASFPSSVVLSASQLSTILKCQTGATAVPKKLTDVCYPYAQATVVACEERGTNLQALLQTTNAVTWTAMVAESHGEGEQRRLDLTAADLPYSDTFFFVGCKNTKKRTEETCRVDITVKARLSAVGNNVVTCAYGAESNPRVLEVEMTEENNTFTLVCGEGGSIKPESYDTQYCEDDKLEKCGKSYNDILPPYESKWWVKEGDTAAPMTLTIPKEDFPPAEQKFYVGCSPSPKVGDQKVGGPEREEPGPAKDPTTCKVLVIVKAASSPYPAGSAVFVAAAVGGSAAVAGLFAGAF